MAVIPAYASQAVPSHTRSISVVPNVSCIFNECGARSEAV